MVSFASMSPYYVVCFDQNYDRFLENNHGISYSAFFSVLSLSQCAFVSSKIMKTKYSSTKSVDDSTATAATQSSSEDSDNSNKQHAIKSKKGRGRRKRGASKSKNCNKSVGYATSTKKHDAPMQKKDMYFAVDCEMVGVGPEALDSALARVSITNWNNEIVLDTYVRVEEEVTDYRTFVSGIRPEHIQSSSAITLQQARSLVKNILNGKVLIGHALENDLKVLALDHPWCDVRDTAKYAPFMRTIEKENGETIMRPKKLKELVWTHFQREIQVIGRSHSPVEDAVAAMDLYKMSRNEWEMKLRQEVNRADVREPMDHHLRTPIGHRFGGDAGNRLLFSAPHAQPQPMAQYGMNVDPAMYKQQQYHHQLHQSMSYGYPMRYHPSSPQYIMTAPSAYGMSKAVPAPSRRSKELARARVVAAMYQQRMRFQSSHQ